MQNKYVANIFDIFSYFGTFSSPGLIEEDPILATEAIMVTRFAQIFQFTGYRSRPSFFLSTGLPILSDARWRQNGITVAGGHGPRKTLNALHSPHGICVDDDQTIYIADWKNHRVMEWKPGAKQGCIVAGGNGQGEQMNQLNWPTDVTIDKETDSLLICDWKNQRVVRWPRSSGTTREETIIENIDCYGLRTDNQGFLYVSDTEKHEVRRYRLEEKDGIVVAGGNGKGDRLNQLNDPSYVFVDADQSVYVSDWVNHRVMKWVKDAKEGVVVAGGHGKGNDLGQLSHPNGLFVDALGTIYVADAGNQRVMRWPKGATYGTVIIDGKGAGKHANQLNWPIGISFDRDNNLYVAEFLNHRVQRFAIEASR
jgi:sugar lactone lactonase YvrE